MAFSETAEFEFLVESRISLSCSLIRSVWILPFRQYILCHICEKSYTLLHLILVDQKHPLGLEIDQSSPSTSLPHTCNSNQLRVILRVCIVNFCSLVSYNKHLELYQLIDTHKPDIIIGTETHLNKDIDSREIFPPNYIYSPSVRKDQDSGEKRGGVVIAVNSNIISVEQSSPAECEIVWCNISHKSGSVVVGSFYRPPYTSVDYLEQLELSMNNIKQLSGIYGKYVLLGVDLKLPDID